MPYTPARLNVALDAANADVSHAQLHDGDPGTGGTSNVLAESSRVAVDLDGATGGEASDTVTFTITGPTSDITHVTLWNAATAGTLQGSAALGPVESFAGPGELTVTVTAVADSS